MYRFASIVIGFLVLPFFAKASCVADFYFQMVGDSMLLCYNTSTGFDAVEWDYDGGEVIRYDERIVWVKLPSDTANVCLTISGPYGCSDSYCTEVYAGAPNEMCNIADCVYPGDANGDRKANNYDLLNIGLGYGASGPLREFIPDLDYPLSWMPNITPDWEKWKGVVNYKHIDCNGDGEVNDEDLWAIYENYSPDDTFSPEPTPGAPPVRIAFQEEVLFYNPETPDQLNLKIDVELGTADQPFEDLYGIAFDIRVPPVFVDSAVSTFQYADDSFLGPSENVLRIEQPVRLGASGRLDIGLSLKGKEGGRTGGGRVITIDNVISADIIGGRKIEDVNVYIERIKPIDSKGNILPFDLPIDSSTIYIVVDQVSDVNDNIKGAALRLFPNPATEQVILDAGALEIEQVRIFNTLGQLQQRLITDPFDNQHIVSLTGMPSGTYWLQASTADGFVTEKLIITEK